MKVLFTHLVPFSLAHGGLQVQIVQTRKALEDAGVEVESLRWWDTEQRGHLIHCFGRAFPGLAEMAHAQKIPCVMSDLLTAQGSRAGWAHLAHRALLRMAERLLPRPFSESLPSQPYRVMDACIALTAWEAGLMTRVYGAPSNRVHVVPNGVEAVFLELPPNANSQQGKWLVCSATITPRKRVLELAKAAIRAEVPVWIIGKPYSEDDPYAAAFRAVAAAAPQWVRYEGALEDRAQLAAIYREARGFVLLSREESLSISALEAAACGCPLFVSDLPWARCVFGADATYCPITANEVVTAQHLTAFYEAAPTLPKPPRPPDWREVARRLLAVYEAVLTPIPEN